MELLFRRPTFSIWKGNILVDCNIFNNSLLDGAEKRVSSSNSLSPISFPVCLYLVCRRHGHACTEKKTNQRTNEILLRVQFRTGYYIARPSAASQQQQQQSAVNLYLCPVWFYRDTESIRPFVYGFQSTIFFSFFLSSSSRLLPMSTMGPIYIHTNCGTINCPFSLAYYCASVREG